MDLDATPDDPTCRWRMIDTDTAERRGKEKKYLKLNLYKQLRQGNRSEYIVFRRRPSPSSRL